MNQTIHIGPGTDIDLQILVESRLLIQGNSGSGKSGVARVIIEKAHRKVQWVVWDIEGEYYTLKELDSDIIIIGGQHADIPLTMELAAKLPAFIIENELNVVIDLSDLKMHERIQFTKIFFETLMDLPMKFWKSILFFLEECHKLAGEQDKQDSATAIKDLMQRGRKRGYAGIPITQRISMLNKSVAAECNTKFIGRTSLDLDMDRSAKELGFSKAADRLKLRDLAKKHFYAYGTCLDPQHVHEIVIEDAKTTMPKQGMKLDFKPGKPTAKLLEMLAKLSEPEKKDRAKVQKPGTEKNDEIFSSEEHSVIVDQLNQTKAFVFELQNDLLQAERVRNAYIALSAQRGSRLNEIRNFILNILDKEETITNIEDLPKSDKLNLDAVRNMKVETLPGRGGSRLYTSPDRGAFDSGGAITSGDGNHVRELGKVKWDDSKTNGVLPPGEKATLIACRQYQNRGGLTRPQLRMITGYKRSSSDAYIQRLETKGYLQKNGNRFVASKEGIQVLGSNYQPLPEGKALQDYWLQHLPAGEKRILEICLTFKRVLSRENIDHLTEYKRSSRDAYIQRLVTKEIIEVTRQGIKASDFLFD